MTRNLILIAATIASSTFAFGASAAITVTSYTYDNAASLNNVSGKDVNAGALDASIGALTDGLGKAGDYTPSAPFWEPGQEGTIYNHLNASIPGTPQPEITFNFAGPTDLASVGIHYGMFDSSAVVNYSSVDVLVDGGFVGNFTGFTDSGSVDVNTIDVLSIDLTGQTGSSVTLQFRGRVWTNGTVHAWAGLTEVEFIEVPEPGSLALFGLGGLVMFRRRRH